MLTIVQAATLALNILLIGGSVVFCLAVLYLLVRLINVKLARPKERENSNDLLSKPEWVKKKGEGSVEDDVPFSEPFTVKTSFDGKRIGKV